MQKVAPTYMHVYVRVYNLLKLTGVVYVLHAKASCNRLYMSICGMENKLTQ